MKTITIFGTRGLILIRRLILILGAAFGVSAGFASVVFAQAPPDTTVIVNPDGKVTYLGTLGGNYSYAYDINDSGQAVGVSRTADGANHAFITGPDGMGMTDLGTLGGTNSEAFGINDSGQVVGFSATKERHPSGIEIFHAFITGPNGKGMTDLGTLGGTHSSARDLNDSGQVVGSSNIPPAGSFNSHAFITGPNGKGMRDLGTLFPPAYHDYEDSRATAISDSGQVVGWGYDSDYPPLAFITGPDGMGMSGLGVPEISNAFDINDAEQVVGVYFAIGNGYGNHAFITGPNGMGMTDLGTLGGPSSEAYGINDFGQVVGVSTTADGSSHAFITGPNGKGMIDLNSYADLPDGYFLQNAEEINNQGQVIATLAIPEPASYALMLTGLGLVGFMARRKKLARQCCCKHLKAAGNPGSFIIPARRTASLTASASPAVAA